MPALGGDDLGWRDIILRHFTTQVAESFPLTLVRDSNGLLADPLVQRKLDQAGFKTRVYDDPLSVRHEYESELRVPCDTGHRVPSLVLVLHGASLQELPFDMLSRARASHRVFEFTVPEIFPTLAPASLADLEPRWLDQLYGAIETEPSSEVRGLDASRDLLMAELFGLEIDRLRHPAHLLSALCRIHIQRLELPDSLARHLIDELAGAHVHEHWPLPTLLTDRDGFLSFLQEQWPEFLVDLAAPDDRLVAREKGTSYGSPRVPFDDPAARGWVASLFLEGQLEPVDWAGAPEARPEAYRWGLTEPQAPNADERIHALATELSEAVPPEDASYQDWLNFAPRWAELGALGDGSHPLEPDTLDLRRGLWDRVDAAFRAWMEASFGSLELVPKPIMLHRVLKHLRARRSEDGVDKVAVFLMDGMAWSQWVALREVLGELETRHSLDERSVFAWVPTITPVSRQALFSGRVPREFAGSITTTAKDEGHWTAFWADEGLSASAIHFIPPRKNEGESAALTRLRAAGEHPMCKVLTMIVPTIDEMAHGAIGGGAALQAQVAHWTRTGWLREGIDMLLSEGFEVWLTSDHGNLECVGTGRPSEGVLAEQRGVRARVFADGAVRTMIARDYANSIAWPTSGLPDDYLPLLSSGRTAFAAQDEVVVSHGGISLEEVIVPFIRISRNAP